MTAFHRTSAWVGFVKRVRPIIARTLPAPCVDPCRDPAHPCPGLVTPGDRWDVTHLPGLDHHRQPFAALSLEAVGPGHAHCNRTNGGRLGRTKQTQQKRDDQRLPREGSGW